MKDANVLYVFSTTTITCCHTFQDFPKGTFFSALQHISQGVQECFGRPFHFKFFKGCLPQILFGLFLNTLTYIVLKLVPIVIMLKISNSSGTLSRWADLGKEIFVFNIMLSLKRYVQALQKSITSILPIKCKEKYSYLHYWN